MNSMATALMTGDVRDKQPSCAAGAHRVCVAQLGSRMHYAIPRMLYQSGQLAHFYTDICAVKGWPSLLHLLPEPIRPRGARRLLGRVPEGVPEKLITSFTKFGWEYARRRSQARTPSESTSVFLWAGKTFCELVLKRGLCDATAIYAFNSAALELLTYARSNGLFAVMEQTIAPFQVERSILQKEHEAFPGWQQLLPDDVYADEYSAREREEWRNADMILCGSEFVLDGIRASGGPAERCCVVPYGVNMNIEVPNHKRLHKPLRVLTVGEVGLRKGTPYIAQAAKKMKGRASFRMVGPINVLPDAEMELRRCVELVGPVPRFEVLRQFIWADVFVLPSLCEGSATVVYEALSCGLPVICTKNTGSVVRDGLDGFIVPVSNSQAIVDKLEQLAADPDLYLEMSTNARKRAAEFRLDSYSERLSSLFCNTS